MHVAALAALLLAAAPALAQLPVPKPGEETLKRGLASARRAFDINTGRASPKGAPKASRGAGARDGLISVESRRPRGERGEDPGLSGRPFVNAVPPGAVVAGDTGTRPGTYEEAFPRRPARTAAERDGRVHAARELERFGVRVDWERHSLVELLTYQVRAARAAELAELGVVVDWREHSYEALHRMLAAARAAR